MAEKVMRMPAPGKDDKIASLSGSALQKKEEEKILRKGDGAPAMAAGTQSSIQSKTTGGQPLGSDVKSYMEPRFGADFSKVRVHTDQESASLNNQLSARAFTFQNHVFFSRDQYQPGTSEGKQLLAHELTHTIQQGHAVQRSSQVSSTTSAPAVQRLGVQDALDYFADQAYHIPGFRLLTIVLGFNPINRRSESRNAANILRALVEVIPGGHLIPQALDNHGVFNRAGAWVEQQLATLGDIGSDIVNGLRRFMDSLSWRDIFDLGGVWNRARAIFTNPVSRLISFGASVASQLLAIVKEVILRPLAALAQGTRGYDLLKAVLGQDPITGEAVPRNADTLIGGFMRLIGQEEIYENLKRGNAVARAYAWFQGTLSGLMGFVRSIPGRIVETISSLTFQDVITISGAFTKVVSSFANIASEFLSWALQQVIGLLEILFSVVAPGAMPFIRRAAGTFQTILRNPVGFVGNLVRAGIQGFRQFSSNIMTHLRAGLVGWITGALTGITLPAQWDFRGILGLVLQILGLTWANVRGRLVRVLGERPVSVLETTFGLVVTLVREGPAAAWQQLMQHLGNLREMLFGQLREWIQTTIVTQAVTRIASMLNPAGAVIQAIIAIYNTIMFFVERMRQIGAVVESVVNSLSAIAAGAIGPAANAVEQTMARLVPVVISFLARLIGLGGISERIQGIIRRIQQPINNAMDRVIDWIVTQARRLGTAAARGTRSVIEGTIRSLRAPQRITLSDLSEAVRTEAHQTRSGTTLYQGQSRSGTEALRAIVTEHPGAAYDTASGALTLPAVNAAAISSASLRGMAERLGRATGASRVTFTKSASSWAFDIQINPTIEGLANYPQTGGRIQPLIDYLQRRITRVQPNRDALLAILRVAATTYNCRLDTDDINTAARNTAPVYQTVVSFTELNPPSGQRAEFYQEVIVVQTDASGTALATTNCPSCGNAPARGEIRTAPHNVVPQHVWRQVFSNLFTTYRLTSLGSPPIPELQQIQSAGTGTGFAPSLTASGTRGRAAATTSGTPASETNDRQCRVCEGYQDRSFPGAPRPGGPATLMQRAEARARREPVGRITVATPGGPVTQRGTVNYLGRQFAQLSPAEITELTRVKIDDVSNRARAIILRLPAGSAVRIALVPVLEAFLADLRTNAETMAAQNVPPGGFPR